MNALLCPDVIIQQQEENVQVKIGIYRTTKGIVTTYYVRHI